MSTTSDRLHTLADEVDRLESNLAAVEHERDRLRSLIGGATQAADWEPGDAQRALQELRDAVAGGNSAEEA